MKNIRYIYLNKESVGIGSELSIPKYKEALNWI